MERINCAAGSDCLAFQWKNAADRGHQLRTRLRFLYEITVAEEASEMGGFFFRVVTADQNDFGLGYDPAQLIDGGNATHVWHDDIHHDHVGPDFACAFQCGQAIMSLVNLPMWLLAQQRTQCAADKRMVIHDEDFGWYGHSRLWQGEGPGIRSNIASV